jgi:hypothetical protein
MLIFLQSDKPNQSSRAVLYTTALHSRPSLASELRRKKKMSSRKQPWPLLKCGGLGKHMPWGSGVRRRRR